MMNSDRGKALKKVVDAIFELLREERISSEIDEPIELAAQTFCLKVEGRISHSVFNRVIARFVRHIYAKGTRVRRNLSEKEALGEAIFLLEHSLNPGQAVDYEGTLVYVTSSKIEGLELVLSGLAETIKGCEKQKYIEWVFVHQVDQLDWQVRCRIVEMYLKQNEECLPSELLNLDPAQLVAHLPELIISHVSTDRVIRQILGFHE